MDINYHELVDDKLNDECDQIRSIAKKSWLSGAAVSLAHLDNVKTNVYNFGLADPRDLRATNLRNRKPKPAPAVGNQNTEPPLSISSSVAWGSNSSIPDLLRQQNGERAPLPKPSRPGSAKYSNTRIRPHSGKKPRPQSAKEPVPDIVSEETQQGFGVKGAKYDPSGRPPKGVPHMTTTGWVGPPAGLKYPDKPPPGAGWKIEFPANGQEDQVNGEADHTLSEQDEREVPPPPYTTPIPPTPEPEQEPEKPKRVFELFIGDPYSIQGQDDEDFYDDLEEELTFASTTTDHAHSSSNNLIGSTPDSHSHSTTQITDGSAPNSRLAESRECLKLNLPIADDDFDEMDEVDTERLLAEAESVSEKLDLKNIISVNKTLAEPTNQYTDTVDSSDSEYETIESPEVNRQRAENLVNTIINESGLNFDHNKHLNTKNKTSFDNNKQSAEKTKLVNGSGHKSTLEHEKSSVKFNEAITTVDITPRNLGRKVDEIHSKRKTYPTRDSDFIDLIEVKNRMEPVLATSKVDISGNKPRPPSGKSRTVKTSHGVSKPTDNRSDRSVSPNACHRHHEAQPPVKTREPLNRAPKVVTTVTVDYGLEEARERQQNKPKKKKRSSDDVLTMMEKINLQDHGSSTQIPNVQDFDANRSGLGEILLETKFKSEPEKNYYEISRHSSMSNVSNKCDVASAKADTNSYHNHERSATPSVVKTTKTIEFNESEPKEFILKSVVDAHVANKENKEYRVKPPSRPSSAKPPTKKPIDSSAQERPGSRLGFVAMAPGTDNKDSQHKTKTLTRPSSAPTNRRPMSGKKTDKVGKGKTDLTEAEKEEREKVIDNLLERTRSMLGHEEKQETEEPKKTTVEKRRVRPASAHVGLAARTKEQNRVKSAVNRRPVSATTTSNRPSSHKHYASYSTSTSSGSGSRKSSAKKTKVIKTEPCIITTNSPYMDEESETEEDLACEEMRKQLAEKGVNIAANTLQRALYPPTGRTKYYHISADLPKKSSISLLSHPKFWLSEEYKRLQKAEKTLERANEIMFLQEKAEKRRAMLEALTPEERKKLLKKKGKKGGRKLRKSKSAA